MGLEWLVNQHRGLLVFPRGRGQRSGDFRGS